MPLRRYINNPILTREDIPSMPPNITDATSVFNPGAVFHDGRFKLLLRVQTRGRRTHLLMAESRDWVRFKVSKHLVELQGIEKVPEEIFHVYDPRITPLAMGCMPSTNDASSPDGGTKYRAIRTTSSRST